MSERLLTTEDAGHRLGVTATPVRAMITAGHLPALKFGPVCMILESDLHLAENRKTGRPPKAKAEKASGPNGKINVTRSKKRGKK